MSSALALLLTLGLAAVDGDDGSLLSRGRAAYDDVRLRDAAEAADTAEERALALVWAGVAAGQAGELAIARRAFDDALRVRCHDTLPTTVSPKVAAVFREALAATWPRGCPAPAPPTATVTVPSPATPLEPGPAPAPTPPPAAAPSAAPEAAPTDVTGLPSPLGLTLVGVGGAAVAVAVGVALKGSADIATAADPATPQVEARDRLDDGNLALAVAGGAGLIGAAILVGGIVVLVLDGSAP